jgi:hypothetical protein
LIFILWNRTFTTKISYRLILIYFQILAWHKITSFFHSILIYNTRVHLMILNPLRNIVGQSYLRIYHCLILFYLRVSAFIHSKRGTSTTIDDAAVSTGLIWAILMWVRLIHWNSMSFNIIKKGVGPTNNNWLIIGNSLILNSLDSIAPNLLGLRLSRKLGD